MSQPIMHKATRTIALEEAFVHPRLWALFPPALQKQFSVVKDSLSDVGPERIRYMDAAGIDLQVLSHVAPGVQMIQDRDQAVDVSREINNWLGGIVKTYPARFAGFAMLPTQSPADAADELERTVKQLGFKGALINGHTQGHYLDEPSFSPLLECAQGLDVPIYIHPIDPPQAVTENYFQNNSTLVTGWGWSVDTGTHVLRMMCAGVFDRYPRLKIIVGHMGELIPYCLPRLDVALTFGGWLLDSQVAATGLGRRPRMEKSVGYYMHENVYITTSGVFDQPAFNCAYANVGIDHILFSVDAPLRDSFEATEFLNSTQLSDGDREKLAHGNAERLLKLSPVNGTRAELVQSPAERFRSSMYGFRQKMKSKMGRALVSFLMK